MSVRCHLNRNSPMVTYIQYSFTKHFNTNFFGLKLKYINLCTCMCLCVCVCVCVLSTLISLNYINVLTDNETIPSIMHSLLFHVVSLCKQTTIILTVIEVWTLKISYYCSNSKSTNVDSFQIKCA
jgi:hypothetical protein